MQGLFVRLVEVVPHGPLTCDVGADTRGQVLVGDEMHQFTRRFGSIGIDFGFQRNGDERRLAVGRNETGFSRHGHRVDCPGRARRIHEGGGER